MKVLSSEQMAQLDFDTIQQYQVPGLLLMERASLEVYHTGLRMMKQHTLEAVIIFCGPGNNGGDGLAAARHFMAAGIETMVVLLPDPASLRGDALVNYHILLQYKGLLFDDFRELRHLMALKSKAYLIVDALFGTGLKRSVEGEYLQAIEWINEQPSKILSIDIPSGINGNTGEVMGAAVKADQTIAFHLPKVGNVSYPGAAFNGKLQVKCIGIPLALSEKSPYMARLSSREHIVGMLPSRPRDSHKGTFGTVTIIGGIEGYSGAGILAAKAAQHTGVGLVKTLTAASLNAVFETNLPEVVTIPIEEKVVTNRDEPAKFPFRFSKAGVKQMMDLSLASHAVIAGPGWGTSAEWKPLLKELIDMTEKPLVLDADALNLLVSHMDWLKGRKTPVVMTPHPGEMARLTGLSINEINHNRLEIAREFARQWEAVVVLKGAGTMIASPDGHVMINTTGNEGMAKAGSGDVLSGIIGSLLAQGVPPFEASVAGCWIHGRAGDVAAERVGVISLTATNIIQSLWKVMKELEEKHDG